MKIAGTGTTATPSLRRAKKSERGGQGQSFRVAVADGASPSVATTAVAATLPVSPLLALQELPDATAERARAIKQGHDLLDQLDRIRYALLSGTIAPPELSRLLSMIKQDRKSVV